MQLEAKPFVPDGVDISNLMFLGNGSTWNFTWVEGLMNLRMWLSLSLLSYMNTKHVNLKKYLYSQSRGQKWGNYLHSQAEKLCFNSELFWAPPPFFALIIFPIAILIYFTSPIAQALRKYLLTWGVNVCVFKSRCVFSLCWGVWGSGWRLCALALSIVNHWPHSPMPEVRQPHCSPMVCSCHKCNYLYDHQICGYNHCVFFF